MGENLSNEEIYCNNDHNTPATLIWCKPSHKSRDNHRKNQTVTKTNRKITELMADNFSR